MYDIIGIGHALMDLCTEVDDSIIEEAGLNIGQMNIITPDKFKIIHSKLDKEKIKIEFGGSVPNTIDMLKLLGCNVGEYGKVGNDEYGDMIMNDKDKKNIGNLFSRSELPTGNVLCLISEDSQRTFAVCLGAAADLSEEDIDEEKIKQAKILHFTGYELESEKVEAAVRKAAEIAKKNNVLVSFDLADPGVVQRNYIELKKFVEDYVDVLFANEDEAEEMTGKPPEKALNALAKYATHTAVVKLGENGSLINNKGNIYKISPNKVTARDSTGAGDSYAAGILYGIINNLPTEEAGKIASYISSKVVEQVGARLDKVDVSKVK